jgi:hypothetical protein
VRFLLAFDDVTLTINVPLTFTQPVTAIAVDLVESISMENDGVNVRSPTKISVVNYKRSHSVTAAEPLMMI